jgi:hypothetical protein
VISVSRAARRRRKLNSTLIMGPMISVVTRLRWRRSDRSTHAAVITGVPAVLLGGRLSNQSSTACS